MWYIHSLPWFVPQHQRHLVEALTQKVVLDVMRWEWCLSVTLKFLRWPMTMIRPDILKASEHSGQIGSYVFSTSGFLSKKKILRRGKLNRTQKEQEIAILTTPRSICNYSFTFNYFSSSSLTACEMKFFRWCSFFLHLHFSHFRKLCIAEQNIC